MPFSPLPAGRKPLYRAVPQHLREKAFPARNLPASLPESLLRLKQLFRDGERQGILCLRLPERKNAAASSGPHGRKTLLS